MGDPFYEFHAMRADRAEVASKQLREALVAEQAENERLQSELRDSLQQNFDQREVDDKTIRILTRHLREAERERDEARKFEKLIRMMASKYSGNMKLSKAIERADDDDFD